MAVAQSTWWSRTQTYAPDNNLEKLIRLEHKAWDSPSKSQLNNQSSAVHKPCNKAIGQELIESIISRVICTCMYSMI